VSRFALVAFVVGLAAVTGAAPSTPVALEITDYLALPITGRLDGTGQTDGMLARINAFREEPGATGRIFLVDLNGPVYILDKASKRLTPYLDFNGREGRAGLFHKLAYEVGFGNGVVTLQFDPDYPKNGKFYTVHIEDPLIDAPAPPDNAHLPGLKLAGYSPTQAVATPGPTAREGVLIEWIDSNRSNTTFEGTARELLRVALNTRIHPLGDLSFNPAARPGDAEWGVLYVSCGDGGAGESPRPDVRPNPQRLDTLVGKILRIVPDLSAQTKATHVSENGRYRIPNDNPFVALRGARHEIWAYGLRNPHRLTWGSNPADPAKRVLITNSIGLRTWETVNVIHRGSNYGYSLREGTEMLQLDNKTTALPPVDKIPVVVGTEITGEIAPTYPVIEYGHVPGGGDAIGSGVLYRGTAIPALQGKYLFTDLSTGRVWYANYDEMLAADDGKADTLAARHELEIVWDDPSDAPDAGQRTYDTMFPIAQAAYHARGGKDPDLPGRAAVSGNGRADAHLTVDAAGELYIFSKTDGMIRAVTGAVQK
jgi:glucose/sorbosone dehydrogenase